MKIRHKILFSLSSILVVLILIALMTYKAFVKVDFYQQRSEVLEAQLLALTNLRAQVRNQILEIYEVGFVEGLKNHETDIQEQRIQVETKFSELERVMAVSEIEVAHIKHLKLEYYFLDQGLKDGIQAVKSGHDKKAKKIILEVRENRFNNGFLRKISERIDAQKIVTKGNSQDLNQSIVRLKEIIGLFSVLVLFLVVGITIYLSKSIGERLADLEDRLRQQQQIVTHSSKMSALGEMAGGIAHEINTPLGVIQMRTEQLIECIQDETLDQDLLHSAVTAIDLTVRRIGKIVNGLRSFARDGRKDPLMPHSAIRIVEDTFSLCQERFRNNSILLEFVHSEDIYILCRPSEIGQVLLNLLNNSFDAIQDLNEKWVRVELATENDDIILAVVDSGSGIPMEVQEKMMQPFFTTKDIGKGTGLGLSISRGIVESHSGKIRIDNSKKNTTFVIQFSKEKIDSLINTAAKGA